MRVVPFTAALLLLAAPATALPPELELVDRPGNVADGPGTLGAVDYEYWIGRYEVTNAEYAAFLQAVAASDPHGLWSFSMGTTDWGGILRSGTPGAYVYTVKPDFADKPVVFLSFYSAVRFANWLHWGMPAGPGAAAAIESGSYDLAGPNPNRRGAGATWVVPDRHEWHKAAYYDPAGVVTPPRWLNYATRSDVEPTAALCDSAGEVTNSGFNVAVSQGACNWNGSTGGNVATVGASGTPSFFGTYDQTGNALEMTEVITSRTGALVVGGQYWSTGDALARSWVGGIAPDDVGNARGFRVAYLPEPDGLAGALAGVATLAALCTRRNPAAPD